ncbi:MAG TPA: penicillin-binding transpeptidase domain-containing protein [Vicinamibacteria bacterium]|nr:penicillin-binding transpeptidase domain-containing protein [Vicinamibacteria bacterium]
MPPALAGEGPTPRERKTRLRLMLLALTISLWALVVGIRLVHLQVLGREFFEQQGARQSERTLTLFPRRGPILDREGRPLAVSVDAESLYAVPQDVTDPRATAAALARALSLDAAGRREVEAKLRRKSAFVWIERKLDPVTARRVRELSLEGIGFLAEHRRYYPQRELAAHVLGYVGLDNTGMGGIEYGLESEIRGRSAKVVVSTDARRRPVAQTERPSTDGATVVLALDEAIQHVAERELERAVEESQAASGMVIVVEPFSGEVLALAGRPTFNPNRYNAYPSSRWRNRAVSDVFEPGSIFKIVTAAAAIQESVVSPDEMLDCGDGRIEVGGTVINDHAVFDQLTFAQAVVKSSDVGMIRVAQRLGRDNFARYVRDFGFGAATGVDLPGESAGLFRPTTRWSALSLPSMSFGQEIGVTGVQIAMSAAAIANGGYLMRPIVVKRVEDAEGRVVKDAKPLVVRRVLHPETVDTLTDILRAVVTEGTGRAAAVPGYVVAGKTGTAQKVDASGRYSMVDHVASFVGWVPVARPALVILASLDTPRGARNQGGDVAAPLFARVAEGALRILAVPPDDQGRVLRAVTTVPETVVPAAYRPREVPRPAVPAPEDEPDLMPDLRGRSAREAAIAAARRGLVVELHGSGQVVAQSPEPGAEIEPGNTCVLTLGREEAKAP